MRPFSLKASIIGFCDTSERTSFVDKRIVRESGKTPNILLKALPVTHTAISTLKEERYHHNNFIPAALSN